MFPIHTSHLTRTPLPPMGGVQAACFLQVISGGFVFACRWQSRHIPLNVPYSIFWPVFNRWWTLESCALTLTTRGCPQRVAHAARHTPGQVVEVRTIFSHAAFPLPTSISNIATRRVSEAVLSTLIARRVSPCWKRLVAMICWFLLRDYPRSRVGLPTGFPRSRVGL